MADQHLRQEFGLDSALELQLETHYRRFLMPTIRGSEQGSKKRYAGLSGKPDGGEFDALLVYRKRLRRPLDEYQRNVPPHVRAARIADEYSRLQGRPLKYQNGGWIRYGQKRTCDHINK